MSVSMCNYACNMSEWSEYLKRVAGHLSQLQIAEATGINASTVSRWFAGSAVPSAKYVLRIASALDLDTTEALAAATATTSVRATRVGAGQSKGVASTQVRRGAGKERVVPAESARPYPDDPVRVGATIRAIRSLRGYKPEEFATMLGTTPAYLTNVESGKRAITSDMAHEAAELLGVPLLALVRDVDGHPEPAGGIGGDATVIDFGEAGTATISLDLRLLEINADQARAVLQLVDEFRKLGRSVAAGSSEE